jgi:hypothetical protein
MREKWTTLGLKPEVSLNKKWKNQFKSIQGWEEAM